MNLRSARRVGGLSGGRDLVAGSGGDRRADPSRAVSVVEVVESFLRRIEGVNPAINAVVTLAAESAINEARAADRSIARGMVAGPFHGVPFTAKDVFETARVETRVGLSERVGIVPSEDAVAVARMRQRARSCSERQTFLREGRAESRTTRFTAGREIRLIGSVLRLEAAGARRRSRRLGDRRSVSAATPVEASGCRLTTAGSRVSNRRLGESRTPALSRTRAG